MKKDLAKLLGNKVKEARKHKCLTQEDLAELIDKTVETVSNIERGVKAPSLNTIYEISKALKVKLSNLMDID
jgi:transcriptional regulator with XRE-family HTH domain